jgi:ComF family protein
VWAQSAAALGYTSPWRELIIDFKFQSHPALCRFLGTLMASDPQIQQLLARSDCVIPVPLSAERLRERGFNQSALLARQLSTKLVDEKILWRLRHTAPQSGLDKSARLNNLLHSMAVNPSMPNAVRNRRVLLIDDVLTTGSTLTVCTQALLSAGAKQVSCAVLARAAPVSGTQ